MSYFKNRNRMYDYLDEIEGLYPLKISHGGVTVDYGRKRFYHTEFRIDANTDAKSFTIVTDWGYIRGCTSIHLCRNELVVESDFGNCKINMYYKNIEKFEVRIDELE